MGYWAGVNPNCPENTRVYGYSSQGEGKGRKMREKCEEKKQKGASLVV